MPDAKRNRNERDYKSYMGEIGSYMDRVRRGRSTRAVDPKQPALNEQAELLRQTDKIDKANAYEKLMGDRREY